MPVLPTFAQLKQQLVILLMGLALLLMPAMVRACHTDSTTTTAHHPKQKKTDHEVAKASCHDTHAADQSCGDCGGKCSPSSCHCQHGNSVSAITSMDALTLSTPLPAAVFNSELSPGIADGVLFTWLLPKIG